MSLGQKNFLPRIHVWTFDYKDDPNLSFKKIHIFFKITDMGCPYIRGRKERPSLSLYIQIPNSLDTLATVDVIGTHAKHLIE